MAHIHSNAFSIKRISHWTWVMILILGNSQFAFSQESETSKERKKLLPDYAITQYAGSIGTVSLGAGYLLGKQDKTHLELFYSYTPEYQGDVKLSAITVKGFRSFFQPVSIAQKEAIHWQPLKLGVGLSYVADQRFFSFMTDLPYESGYYWHRTGLRSMALFQTEVVKKFSNSKIKYASLYLEANIQDLYVTLYLADKNFTAYDMVMFGVGARIGFE